MKLRTKFVIVLSLALFIFGICALLQIFSDTVMLGAAISSPLWTFIVVYAQEKHADLAMTLITYGAVILFFFCLVFVIGIYTWARFSQLGGVAEARAEAEKKIAEARGDSEALRLRAQSLTQTNLDFERLQIMRLALEKWNGSVPSTVIPGTTIPFTSIKIE